MVRSRSVVVVAEVARSGLSGGGGAAALSEDAMFVLVCVCLFFFSLSCLARRQLTSWCFRRWRLRVLSSLGKALAFAGEAARERERAGSENKGVMHDQAIKGGEKKKCLKSSIQLDDVVQNHFSAFAWLVKSPPRKRERRQWALSRASL